MAGHSRLAFSIFGAHGKSPATGDAAVATRNLSGSSGSRAAVAVETKGMSGRAMS